MIPINAVAILCEDIRFEVSGSSTIVGTLSDNIEVAAVPFILPKLGIYVRVNIPISVKPENLQVFMRGEAVVSQLIAELSADAVSASMDEAESSGGDTVGLLFMLVASPFQVTAFGRLTIELTYGEYSDKIAELRFKQAPLN